MPHRNSRLGTERPLLVGAAIDKQADWLNQESPQLNCGECQKLLRQDAT
ncbi:MAG: hypothetical protein ICV78_14390 [Tolypothrix sp. Co-bin9]|nr:hypothetical protein [Tolypothrix sp. Co-bin9]